VLAVRLLEVWIDHRSNVAQSFGPRDRVLSSCASHVFWFFWGVTRWGGLPPAGHTQRNQANPTAGGSRQSLTSEIRLTLSQEVPSARTKSASHVLVLLLLLQVETDVIVLTSAARMSAGSGLIQLQCPLMPAHGSCCRPLLQVESDVYERTYQRCQNERMAQHRAFTWGNRDAARKMELASCQELTKLHEALGTHRPARMVR
jgi:hypothetical protein